MCYLQQFPRYLALNVMNWWRQQVTFPLAPLVFEIFELKVADKQTDKQTFTSTDNKGPLKLSAREPIIGLFESGKVILEFFGHCQKIFPAKMAQKRKKFARTAMPMRFETMEP